MEPVEPPTVDEVRALAARGFGGEFRRARRIDEGDAGIATFDVDDRFIVKVALDGSGAEELVTERTVLPAVAAAVRVDVPRIQMTGERRGRPFIGYPKLAGRSGEDLRPTEARWEGLADQLGGFLSAVHALPPDLSPRPSGEPWSALTELPSLAETIERGAPHLLTHEMRRYLQGDVPEPPAPDRAVFCHGDLKGEHLLLVPAGWRVSGVIDWGDARPADPAVDLAGLVIWLGPRFTRMVADRYAGADEGLVDRAVTLARAGMLLGLGDTLRGDGTWPYVRTQLRQAFLD